MFYDLYLGKWEPSGRSERLHQIAKQYHEETEAFDQTVCSAVNERGVAMPTTNIELRLININAQKVKRRLIDHNSDIEPSEIGKAIRRYGVKK
jgi:hypothetical protein